MKIPSPKTPTRNEIPDVPEDARYLDEFFTPRDKTLEDVVDAMHRRLSPLDNMNYERRKLHVVSGAATQIQLERIAGLPAAVYVEWTEYDEFHKMKWRVLGQDSISVTITFDTDPGVLTLVQLGIWGD